MGDNDDLKHQRSLLRETLYHNRGKYIPGQGYVTLCPICNKNLRVFDMHEVIITRGMIQKADESTRMLCHVKENCVLVHPGACHIEAATKAGVRKCIIYLWKHEGPQIFTWLFSIEDLLPVVSKQQLLLVKSCLWEYE